MAVPHGASLNATAQGLRQPRVVEHDIAWRAADDPAALPEFPAALPLFAGKIGGLCLVLDELPADERYVMQISEQPAEFNFAGRSCILARTAAGEIIAHVV